MSEVSYNIGAKNIPCSIKVGDTLVNVNIAFMCTVKINPINENLFEAKKDIVSTEIKELIVSKIIENSPFNNRGLLPMDLSEISKGYVKIYCKKNDMKLVSCNLLSVSLDEESNKKIREIEMKNMMSNM